MGTLTFPTGYLIKDLILCKTQFTIFLKCGMCLKTVNELPRNDKTPSFTCFVGSAFLKECAKTHTLEISTL